MSDCGTVAAYHTHIRVNNRRRGEGLPPIPIDERCRAAISRYQRDRRQARLYGDPAPPEIRIRRRTATEIREAAAVGSLHSEPLHCGRRIVCLGDPATGRALCGRSGVPATRSQLESGGTCRRCLRILMPTRR